MVIEDGSEFGINLYFLLREAKPKRILETGTYLGLGSTLVFAKAIQELGLDCKITSIEINEMFHNAAKANLKAAGVPDEMLELRCGLSIPRSELPSVEKIRLEIEELKGVYHDHLNYPKPEELYYEETLHPFAEDDLLRQELTREPKPGVVLLDSAGHLGWREFQQFLEHADSCWVALDDCNHIKHIRSFIHALDDGRFTVRAVGGERNGWAILRYEKE